METRSRFSLLGVFAAFFLLVTSTARAQYGAFDPLNGAFSTAYGINDARTIVGFDITLDDYARGYVRRWNQSAVPLRHPAGITDFNSTGRAINNFGRIAGWHDARPNLHAGSVWDSNGNFVRSLSTLNSEYTEAYAINDLDWCAGSYRVTNGITRPVVWNQLSVPIFPFSEGVAGVATGININNEVVGWIVNATNQHQAFRWTQRAGYTLLPGTLPSEATGINDFGTIVGYATISTRKAASLWKPSGSPVTYTRYSMGSLLSEDNTTANAISPDNFIVGTSVLNSTRTAFSTIYNPTNNTFISLRAITSDQHGTLNEANASVKYVYSPTLTVGAERAVAGSQTGAQSSKKASVIPANPDLQSRAIGTINMKFSPNPVIGGQNTTATINLVDPNTQVNPYSTVVNLLANNLTYISNLPNSVSVPLNSVTKTFTLNTTSPAAPQTVPISVEPGYWYSNPPVYYDSITGRQILTETLYIVPVRTVSGTIALQGSPLRANKTLNLIFQHQLTRTQVLRTATLNSAGTYSLSNVPAGPYNISFKVDKWLARVLLKDISNSNGTGVNVSLLSGDSNYSDGLLGDNVVDILDLVQLLGSYNKHSGQLGFNPDCDFNEDGDVDIADLLLIISNYNVKGDALAP